MNIQYIHETCTYLHYTHSQHKIDSSSFVDLAPVYFYSVVFIGHTHDIEALQESHGLSESSKKKRKEKSTMFTLTFYECFWVFFWRVGWGQDLIL